MNLSKVVKSILKTAIYVMDQTADTVDRASDRAFEIADDARSAIYPREDQTLRRVLAFAAGVGVGVGAGILLAPSSGTELRNSIGNKVHEIKTKVRNKGNEAFSTGTEAR